MNHANPENVVSDDDSFLQELEQTPTIRRKSGSAFRPLSTSHNNHAPTNCPSLSVDTKNNNNKTRGGGGIASLCPPLLSPNEELTLLAVKHKPNSPDHDADGDFALEPPRSSLSLSKQKRYNNRNEEHQQQQTRKVPVETTTATTYMDPTTGEVIHTQRPMTGNTLAQQEQQQQQSDRLAKLRAAERAKVERYHSYAKGPMVPAVSSSSTASTLEPGAFSVDDSTLSSSANQKLRGRTGTKFAAATAASSSSYDDSLGTSTPSTLIERLQASDDEEMQPYTTSYLPSKNAARTRRQQSSGDSSTSIEGVESGDSSFLANLGSTALADEDSYQDDNDGNSSSIPSLPDDTLPDRNGMNANSSFVTRSHQQVLDLIDAEVYDEGAQREQIRRQAEYDAERRLLSNALSAANAKIIVSPDEDPWLPWKVYGAVGCLLLCVLAAVIIFFSIQGSEDGGPKPGMNIKCSTAMQLTNLTGGTVQGEILQNIAGNLDTDCLVEPGEGYTLWYYVQGNDQRLIASTCEGTGLDDESDTQVLVFAGPCGKLTCIGGSDELCGQHGSVGWIAEQGTRYYIVVKGFRTSNTGNFTLTINTLPRSGNCQNAREIKSFDSLTIGSTRNQTLDDSIITCDENNAIAAPASWFRMHGDGSVVCASVFTEESQKPEFSATLSILDGSSCNDLSCIGGALPGNPEPWITGDIAFVASEGSFYYAIVRGILDRSQGDFILDLTRAPPNGICEKAQALSVGAIGENGTMVNACNVQRSECSGLLDAPGVWYTVEGTGELLIVRILGLKCRSESDIQSQVSVFVGGAQGCSDLKCIDFTPVECTASNEKVASQWFSDQGELYYVLVQSSDERDFEVHLEEFLPGGAGVCANASSLLASGDISLGSTLASNPAELGDCSNSTARGVWYLVHGTGGSLRASTCNPGTNYSTDLTILSGSCDGLQCVDAKTITCDGERTIAYWETSPGIQYEVYVHGQEEIDAGRFTLTIEDAQLFVENDYCGTAEMMYVPSTIFSSTAGATEDLAYSRLCGDVATAPGLWYTVTGTGRFITASLCGDGTQYDTQLYVFAGDSCKNLTCVNFNEDGCGNQSVISWNAAQDTLYYILVGGFNNAVGDFQLTISEG